MRQGALSGLIMLLFGFAACQPAGRYPFQEPPEKKKDDEAKKTFPANWAWMKPVSPAFDVPIVFIPDSDPSWANLPAFWNHFPAAPAGKATCHLGQSPLGAVAAIVLAGHAESIKIKVPRGLPDPTANIPTSNPPTLAKWQLGKSLFYDPILAISSVQKVSCTYCHDPKRGFCEEWAITRLGRKNTPSLINCVYNKHQFWDGRARFLEQILTRELDDENVVGERQARDHIWSGLVPRLRADPVYEERFRQVFGVKPTQDNIAKALATYMRTILSGNSVYDRAQAARGKDGDVTAKHFETALTSADLNALGQGKKVDAAKSLAQGYNLYRGKARCQLCHSGPLFTDDDFHNVGLGDSDIRELFDPERGAFNFESEQGRFSYVPVGSKESRLIGAYRTPTLRNLPRTEPYMHNGKFKTLEEVVDFFDRGIKGHLHENLAKQLLDGPGQAQRLNLTKEEIGDLVLFLRALDGDAIDPLLLAPSKNKQ